QDATLCYAVYFEFRNKKLENIIVQLFHDELKSVFSVESEHEALRCYYQNKKITAKQLWMSRSAIKKSFDIANEPNFSDFVCSFAY
ncbi:MAG: hypothetical protein AABX82_07845, partial [Nanoarchaeota archaeon]